jgi:nitrate/TMAO reductase-like tetraheme cytochrome c subunit
MNHAALTAGGVPCKNCHDSNLNPTGAAEKFTGMSKKRNGHEGYNSGTQDCISCHANQYNRWNHP